MVRLKKITGLTPLWICAKTLNYEDIRANAPNNDTTIICFFSATKICGGHQNVNPTCSHPPKNEAKTAKNSHFFS